MASRRIAKLVDAPTASVVEPKLDVTLNPAGTVMGAANVRLLVPTFLTVNVLLTGVPVNVLPKLSLPVPSGMSLVPSNTWISGWAVAVTVPETVKSKGFSLLSLLANDRVPL